MTEQTEQGTEAAGRIAAWTDTPNGYVLLPEHIAADLRTVLAALDSAQGRVGELEAQAATERRDWFRYSPKTRRHLEAERAKVELAETIADRDRLAARVAELETLLGQILARFDTKGHPGYAAVRTAWIRVELVRTWRKVAKGRVAGESGDGTGGGSDD